MRIELATKEHHQSLAQLLCELHAYYNEGSTVSRESALSYLMDTLLAPNSPLKLVVACPVGNEVAGFAAVSLTYSLVDPSPEQCGQCWLKELYVRSGSRSGGVGRALMSWVARYAAENGCRRIDWTVNASNTQGIAFYERLDARRVMERLSYRLAESSLSLLAESAK